MKTTIALILFVAVAASYFIIRLLCCRHRSEVLCEREDGMGLRCVDCGRTRSHPLGGEPARYHRTQERRPDPPTGIERAAMDAEIEAAEQRRVFAVYERQMIGERVSRKFKGRA